MPTPLQEKTLKFIAEAVGNRRPGEYVYTLCVTHDTTLLVDVFLLTDIGNAIREKEK